MARKNRQAKRGPEQTSPAASERGATLHVTAQQSTQVSFRGPIPPPEILEAYERVLMGSADRILTMAEEQSRHRKRLEEAVVKGGSRNQILGMTLAFMLSLVTIILGGFLIFHDKNLEGFGLVLADLVALVGVFIYGRRTQREELKASRDSFSE